MKKLFSILFYWLVTWTQYDDLAMPIDISGSTQTVYTVYHHPEITRQAHQSVFQSRNDGKQYRKALEKSGIDDAKLWEVKEVR